MTEPHPLGHLLQPYLLMAWLSWLNCPWHTWPLCFLLLCLHQPVSQTGTATSECHLTQLKLGLLTSLLTKVRQSATSIEAVLCAEYYSSLCERERETKEIKGSGPCLWWVYRPNQWSQSDSLEKDLRSLTKQHTSEYNKEKSELKGDSKFLEGRVLPLCLHTSPGRGSPLSHYLLFGTIKKNFKLASLLFLSGLRHKDQADNYGDFIDFRTDMSRSCWDDWIGLWCNVYPVGTRYFCR